MISKIRMLIFFPFILNFLTVEAKTSNFYKHEVTSGVQWVSGLTWEQIKKKAHDENKYIFMDCFATWCGPCKTMDQKVYPNDTVGSLMNSNFICVRLQMDSTKSDNGETKKWYTTVKAIEKEYIVNAMPTFLFFAPNGQIVHKEVGGRNVQQFISLVESATDSSKQYYNVLRQYREGKLDYSKVPSLARMALSNGERDLAFELARNYMKGYLDQAEQRYFKKENQRFIYEFAFGMLRSSDQLFILYLKQPKVMDSILEKVGGSQQIVDYVINKEEIYSAINKKENGGEPEWGKISDMIEKKYGVSYANRTVLNARVNFYKFKKDWSEYAKYLVKKVEMEKKQGQFTYGSAIYLNGYAWDVFLYSKNRTDLKKALEWSERSLKLLNPTSFNVGPHMDTKANILYKLGKTKEAIKQEEDALQRIIADSEKFGFIKKSLENYKKTLQNMKSGEFTYLEEGAIWQK